MTRRWPCIMVAILCSLLAVATSAFAECAWVLMSASVIDLKDGREVGPIGVGAEGERLLVLLLPPIPIFWYAQTVRGPVCKALGERLGNYLAGRDPLSSPTRTPDK